MNRRWRNLTTRSRQRRFDPPFVGLAPAAPTTPVVFKSSRRRTSVVARRGEFFPLVSVQQLPPGRVEPTPKRIGKARRGSFFAIVPQALAAGPAPLVPIMAATRRPRPTMEPRRGAHFAAPLQGAVAGTAPLVPSLQRQTRRPQLSVRRGEFLPQPWPQVTPTPAGFVPRQTRRQTRALRIRRGEFVLVPPTSTPAAAPTLTPKLLRAASRRLVITRSGSFVAVPLAGATPATPGFVCQDFSATVTVDAYASSVTVDTYAGTVTVDAYSATVSIDAYGGTATNCGR